MRVFNIVKIGTGRLVKTIQAESYRLAFDKALELNLNVYDDYFLQTPEQTKIENTLNSVGRLIYQDEYSEL